MTTIKQAEWDKYKAEQWLDERLGRGVAVTIPEVRKKTPCTCVHTAKKHKKTGRCRKVCPCEAGIR